MWNILGDETFNLTKKYKFISSLQASSNANIDLRLTFRLVTTIKSDLLDDLLPPRTTPSSPAATQHISLKSKE